MEHIETDKATVDSTSHRRGPIVPGVGHTLLFIVIFYGVVGVISLVGGIVVVGPTARIEEL